MPPTSNQQPPKPHAIVYYSRDGHTDRLARQLAETLDADLFQITTDRYTSKSLGYLRAGFDSLTGRMPTIAPIPNLSGYASLSLGAPIWTSYPATPLRAYLASHPNLPEAVGMFTTCAERIPQDKAFAMARGWAEHPFVATLNVPNSLAEPEADRRISAYCEALTSAAHVAESA